MAHKCTAERFRIRSEAVAKGIWPPGSPPSALLNQENMLVVPAAFDQPDNAVRIHRLGLGDFLLPKEYRKPDVIARLKRLMAPEVRERCQQRARQLRATQTLETSCRLIEDLM